jgi:hypothetical protein
VANKGNQVVIKGVSSLVLAVGAVGISMASEDQDQVKLGTISNSLETVDVVAQRDSIQAVTPVQATLEATEPQTVISRAFIEEQVPATPRACPPSPRRTVPASRTPSRRCAASMTTSTT